MTSPQRTRPAKGVLGPPGRTTVFAEMTALAQEHGAIDGTQAAHLVLTYANACSVFDPAGTEIPHYRKIHPFTMVKEDAHYLAGDSVETAEVEGLRVTPPSATTSAFPNPLVPVRPGRTGGVGSSGHPMSGPRDYGLSLWNEVIIRVLIGNEIAWGPLET